MKNEEKTDPILQKAFGNHIRKLRNGRGWTQADLEVISKVSESQISNIETGEAGPTLYTIRRLAFAFGIHPSDLFRFEFDFKFNTNFNIKFKKSRPGTTLVINSLVKEGFFKKPKTVAHIISHSEIQLGKKLESADTSGALLRLVQHKILKRTQIDKNGKGHYQNV